MKFARVLIGALVVLGVLSAIAARPASAEMMCTEEMLPTIASLSDCVSHAYAAGHIDNLGVAQALQATLSTAQAALDRGQPAVAINILQAFIYQVQAQAGVHITADHAQHMIEHAQMVIAALSALP